MIDPVRDLATLKAATERLLVDSEKLDDGGLRQPSRLPGWSRGHVLAHLARNADALVNVFEGRPMYADAEVREADIERDAPRPLAAQLDDVRASAARFEATADTTSDWQHTVELRNGVTDIAARVPFRRLVEVELHHVDLDIGYGLGDLPAAFVARETAFLAQRFAGHPDVRALHLTTPDGSTWHTGRTEGDPLTVTGSAEQLMGWLAGRTLGESLTAAGGADLPVLPPL